MSRESRRMAGILLVVLPTVMIGGVILLSLLVWEPAYAANQLRQDLWRAGHAHAGVLLVLSLVILRYVDDCAVVRKSKMVCQRFRAVVCDPITRGLFPVGSIA